MFHFVRDYETVKVEQEVPNEFLLVLDEGGDEVDAKGVPRPKGAYYKNIERKITLKKKRVNVSNHFQPSYLSFLTMLLVAEIRFGVYRQVGRHHIVSHTNRR